MKVNLPEVRVQVTLLLIILNLLQALLGLLQFKKLGYFQLVFCIFFNNYCRFAQYLMSTLQMSSLAIFIKIKQSFALHKFFLVEMYSGQVFMKFTVFIRSFSIFWDLLWYLLQSINKNRQSWCGELSDLPIHIWNSTVLLYSPIEIISKCQNIWLNKKNLACYIAFSDWQIESHSLSQIESEPICGAFVNFVLYMQVAQCSKIKGGM